VERKLVDCKDAADRWEEEAHELKKALSAAQTQAVTYAESLQVGFEAWGLILGWGYIQCTTVELRTLLQCF